jgi:DHA1 family bicyclomycin/chloramphenicol resistance-like MFS transporter
MNIATSPAHRPQTRRLIYLLGLLTAFAPFATDMYLSSFPAIAASLGTSVDRVQYSLSTFIAGMAIGQLAYGPLIDRFGRKTPLLAGIGLYVLASLGLLCCRDIGLFVVLRLMQALGGAAGMIISRAIIRDLFDQRQAAEALSTMMVVQGVGPIAAPIIGSYILELANWRAIFIFLTLFGTACLLWSAHDLPETLPPERRERQSPRAMLATFGQLLARPRFIVPVLSSSCAIACMFAFISGSPFVFINLHHISPQHYSWLFGLNALGMTLASQINRHWLARSTPATLYRQALLLNVCAGAALFAVSGSSATWLLVVPLFCCLATVPAIGANATAIAMSHCGENAGSASALIGVLQFAIAGLVSALIALLHDGTARPMTGMIFACGLCAIAIASAGKPAPARQAMNS